MLQPDGSIAIAWHADGFESLRVRARFRSPAELDAFARTVADICLLERSLPGLRTALRRRFPGDVDIQTLEPADAAWTVVISLHPPRGVPNPDPG